MPQIIKNPLFFPFFLIFLTIPTLSLAEPSFQPFTKTKNICPSCPAAQLDKVTLKSGENVDGQIVSNNTDFYTIYRYGEYRVIPNNQVQAIKWSNGARPTNLQDSVQIVLKSGTTFNGKIKTDNEKPGYIILELPELGQNITIFKDQIELKYVDGKKTN